MKDILLRYHDKAVDELKAAKFPASGQPRGPDDTRG
jgi:hypothetical protein